MKNILIAIALLVSSTVAAQSLKVTVLNDLSQPMSFAYLYLNGKPMLVTDSLGQAILPQTMMQAGDTLSAVVIGTNPVNAICDSLLNREEYTFIINEIYNSYDIDEVIVTTDIRKIYLKSTKLLPTIIYNCELFANFEIEDQISGCRAQGSCTATNIPYSKYYQS